MPKFFLRLDPRAIAIALVFSLGGQTSQATEYQELSVIGKWRVTKALDSADISSLDEREAQRIIGRVFTISKDTVKLGKKDDCLPPEFEAKLVETRAYIRSWAHASADNLGLPNPVTVVDLGCTSAFIKKPSTHRRVLERLVLRRETHALATYFRQTRCPHAPGQRGPTSPLPPSAPAPPPARWPSATRGHG